MNRRRPTDLRYTDTGKRPPWWAIRRHVLDRDDWHCQACGVRAAEVDHKWPIHYGGDDRGSNLQALCSACNRSKGNTVAIAVAETYELEAAIRAIHRRVRIELADAGRFLDGLTCRLPDDEVEAVLRGAVIEYRHLASIASTDQWAIAEWLARHEPSEVET